MAFPWKVPKTARPHGQASTEDDVQLLTMWLLCHCLCQQRPHLGTPPLQVLCSPCTSGNTVLGLGPPWVPATPRGAEGGTALWFAGRCTHAAGPAGGGPAFPETRTPTRTGPAWGGGGGGASNSLMLSNLPPLPQVTSVRARTEPRGKPPEHSEPGTPASTTQITYRITVPHTDTKIFNL